MKKWWFLIPLLVLASACAPQEEVVANVPTATFLPIPSALPRFTATPEATRTPLPTFTFTPTNTPIPPTITNTPVPTATPTVSGIVQSMQRVNVRQGPGETFPFFDSLAPGTGVQVIGQNAEGTWFNVRLSDGREGWISARLLFIPPTATPLALPSPSPDMTALFSAALPTAILGGAPITPTPLGIAVTATPIGAATDTPAAPPTATQPLVPIVSAVPNVNLSAINQTATALAQGAATATPIRTMPTATEQRVLTIEPAGTLAPTTSAQIVPTAGAGVATGGGVDNRNNPNVFAFCDRLAYGVPVPTNLRAGQTIDIWWSWFARTQSQVQDHITHSNVDLRVNGQPIPDVNSYVTAIRPSGGDFVASWFIPFGPLAAGDYEITYVVTWNQRIYDGYKFFGPESDTPFEQETCRFRVN